MICEECLQTSDSWYELDCEKLPSAVAFADMHAAAFVSGAPRCPRLPVQLWPPLQRSAATHPVRTAACMRMRVLNRNRRGRTRCEGLLRYCEGAKLPRGVEVEEDVYGFDNRMRPHTQRLSAQGSMSTHILQYFQFYHEL